MPQPPRPPSRPKTACATTAACSCFSLRVPPTGSVAFVRKTLNGLDAVAKSLEKSGAPTTRRVGGSLLVRLLVRLCIETHRQMIRRRVFLHRDAEFDHLIALALIDGKEMKMGQLVRPV